VGLRAAACGDRPRYGDGTETLTVAVRVDRAGRSGQSQQDWILRLRRLTCSRANKTSRCRLFSTRRLRRDTRDRQFVSVWSQYAAF